MLQGPNKYSSGQAVMGGVTPSRSTRFPLLSYSSHDLSSYGMQ